MTSGKTSLTIDALRAFVGQETGVSRWITIDQARIDAFAEVTEDFQFIHVDPVKARETPFGGTIAHGLLTLSMLSAMAYDALSLPSQQGIKLSVNYGFDKVRFVAPTPSGARIRGRFRLESVTPRGENEVLIRNIATVEIEGGAKPALVAEWLTMWVMDPEVQE